MPRLPLALLLIALVGGCGALDGCGADEADEALAGEGPEALAALAVAAEATAPDDTTAERRAFFLSDKAGAFYYDALAGPQDDEAMGLTVGGDRLLDGWRWWFPDDSTQLGPPDRTRGVARPDFAVRAYAARDTSGFFERLIGRLRGAERRGLTERVTLLDGRNALLVEVADSIGALAFQPVAGDQEEVGGYEVIARGPTLLVARGDTVSRAAGRVPQQWLAVRADDGRAVAEPAEDAPEANRRRAFALGRVSFSTPGRVVVAVGATPQEAEARAARALADAGRLREARAARMVEALERAPFDTEDDAFDRALQWANLTLDALVARDTAGTYLLPGLPGREPTDGRSGLQALDAFLATGRWETARALLATYGRVQRFDERIDVLGRAPNVVLPGGEGQFTTSDATPIYIAAAGDYVRTSGDQGLVSGEDNFWFKTVFAFRGLYNPARRLGQQLSPAGFLLARDGQTWMRTGGETEPVVRTGLAVEQQGQFYRALRTMTEFATIMGVVRRETGAWYADTANVLQRQFPARFVRDSLVVDHYTFAGQADRSVRPNALLALRDVDLPPEQKARLAREVAERLAFAHGVATLPQSDTLFHPFLDAPAYYRPEGAIYSGSVWTWLSGPLASLMAQTGAPELAYEQVRHLASFVMERGVVGAIPDVLDGHPQGERPPGAGGAPVQPWSLAELVRVSYEDLAGVTYAAPNEVVLEPRLPEAWGETETRFRIGDGRVDVRMSGGDALAVRLEPSGELPEGAVVRVRAFGQEKRIPLVQMQGDTLAVAVEPVEVRITSGGVEVDGEDAEPDARYAAPDPLWWEGFAWLEPDVRDEYPVMRAAAAERRLTDDQLLRDNPFAIPILTQPDPSGDDWGSTSTYTYPERYPDGVLDATYLELAEDDSTTYVRAEFAALASDSTFGRPPTFVALVIDTEEGGQRRVERDALYDFPDEQGYEYVVWVGDGLLVEDAGGNTLGEVEPGRGSVFDVEGGALAFALPRTILPALPRNTRVTLLVGANEGEGVGSFRRVERRASRDVGGGKVDPRAPNVYDQISGSVSR